jgi:hypothetical protein
MKDSAAHSNAVLLFIRNCTTVKQQIPSSQQRVRLMMACWAETYIVNKEKTTEY